MSLFEVFFNLVMGVRKQPPAEPAKPLGKLYVMNPLVVYAEHFMDMEHNRDYYKVTDPESGQIKQLNADVFKQHFASAEYEEAGMGFEHACLLLKQGHRVARRSWNHPGEHIFYTRDPVAINRGGVYCREYLMRTTPDRQDLGLPYLVSAQDLAACDWYLYL